MLNQIASLTLMDSRVDIMVRIPKESFGTYDFYKAAEIIREGERATILALDGHLPDEAAGE